MEQQLQTATLPSGETIFCVNRYEVEFAMREQAEEDYEAHGIDLPPDGVYLDVGANIGLFAIALARRCPRATIVSYEPLPQAFCALEKNLAAIPGAQALRLGLGAKPGTVTFDYFPGITALSTCKAGAADHMAASVRTMLARETEGPGDEGVLAEPEFVDQLLRREQVDARLETVSGQLAELELDRVDLLKIDTEGSESDVLAGIAPEDWPRIRQLMVEIHLGPDQLEVTTERLEGLGYRTSRRDHPLSGGEQPFYHLFAARP